MTAPQDALAALDKIIARTPHDNDCGLIRSIGFQERRPCDCILRDFALIRNGLLAARESQPWEPMPTLADYADLSVEQDNE